MRHIHFVSFATVAALIGTAACGSDSSGGGSGGTSSGGTSSGGTSSGGTAGSGTGGSAGVGTGGTATGGAAGTGTGGTATGGAAGTGTGGTATGGTGGGATGACTNAPDQAIITAPNSDIEGKVGKCGQDNLGAEPATKDCIKQQTGLSDPCVTCFDNTIQCAVTNCLFQCLGASDSQACIACRAQFCDGPFETCSGLTVN